MQDPKHSPSPQAGLFLRSNLLRRIRARCAGNEKSKAAFAEVSASRGMCKRNLTEPSELDAAFLLI